MLWGQVGEVVELQELLLRTEQSNGEVGSDEAVAEKGRM